MTLQWKWLVLAALAVVVAGRQSQATLPATPEHMLCNSTYVIVADVLTATSADCRAAPGSHPACGPRHLVRLQVQVKEILGAPPSDAKRPPGRTLWVGETIDVTTSANVEYDPVGKYDSYGGLVFKSSTGEVLSEERLRAAYVDQRFLMSISMTKDDLETRDAVRARVWPITRKAWALKVMSDPKQHLVYDCPRPS